MVPSETETTTGMVKSVESAEVALGSSAGFLHRSYITSEDLAKDPYENAAMSSSSLMRVMAGSCHRVECS